MLRKGREAAERGDYRWAAMLLDHVVFAEPENDDAREALAGVYDQLGYRAESGPWRDVYLTGALELRHGVQGGGARPRGRRGPAAPSAGRALLRLDGDARSTPAKADGKQTTRSTSSSPISARRTW